MILVSNVPGIRGGRTKNDASNLFEFTAPLPVDGRKFKFHLKGQTVDGWSSGSETTILQR